MTPGGSGIHVPALRGLYVPVSAQHGRELFAVTCVEGLGVWGRGTGPQISISTRSPQVAQNRQTKDREAKFMVTITGPVRPRHKWETKTLSRRPYVEHLGGGPGPP